MIIDDIKKEVSILLASEKSGHGMDHIERVLDLSNKLAYGLDVDSLVLKAIALLHDVDDYKLVGIETSKELSNAKRILNKYNLDDSVKKKILESISEIGYSKRLAGITPKYLEGMIVSDADMLDAMGASGITRSIEYALSKGRKIFNKDIFPKLDLDSNGYKNEKDTTMINHVFEKLLRLKNLMLTKIAKEEAIKRHELMVNFLKEYFEELNLKEWQDYLEEYLSTTN